MENEYESLRGLDNSELRLNLLHWVGLRKPKSSPMEVAKEAEAMFGYVRFGLIATNLDELPSKKLDPELLQGKMDKVKK